MNDNSIEIVRYSPDMAAEWDNFVANTKNATFLHLRGYMDYHSDRFNDYSLIALKNNRIIGVLPANRENSTLFSHKGLTYGSWLVPTKHFDITTMLSIWGEMSKFLKSNGINRLIYKPVPYIYHSYPAQEDLYAIFRHDGKLIESNISSAIPVKNALRFDENARRAVKAAKAAGVTVTESSDFESFWHILSELLQSKYGTKPVHTIDEIKLLASRFPENIKLVAAMLDGKMLGGSVLYKTRHVVHAQYIAASPDGKQKKILPLVFDHIINNINNDDISYFDFGISNEQGGRYLNEGLVMQKNGMGGRGIVYNTYSIDI